MGNLEVVVPLSDYKLLDTPLMADQILSIYYNGYIYTVGSWTEFIYVPTFSQIQHGGICKIKEDDFTNKTFTAIKGVDTNVDSALNLYSLCRVGEMLYTCGYVTVSGSGIRILIQYNTIDDTYKIWKMNGGGVGVATDNTYLYIWNTVEIRKYLENDFRDSLWTKHNTNYDKSGAPIDLHGMWNSYLANIGGSPFFFVKGDINQVLSDGNYIYAIFSGADSSKRPEIHKVNKTTMLSEAWAFIPTNGYQVDQNTTHIFVAAKLGTSWNSSTYGYNWSAVAINKSTMVARPLVRFGGSDVAPSIYAHDVKSIGDHLFVQKSDYITYMVDLTNVDTWASGDTNGSYVQQVINYRINDLVLNGTNYQRKPNTLQLTNDGKFISTMIYGDGRQGVASSIMRFDVSGYTFTPPVISALSANTVVLITTLSAHAATASGTTISEVGVRWGFNTGVLNHVVASLGSNFNITLSGLTTGTYYYQAYAINENGEGTSAITPFTITGNDDVPTVITKSFIEGNYLMTLRGEVAHINGQTQTQCGFQWGLSPTALTHTVISASATTNFQYILSGTSLGVYYYRAFADNSVGRGYSNITTFEVSKYLRIDVPASDRIVFDGTMGYPKCQYIHGSAYYNGYIYGSCRNQTTPPTTELENIVKVNVNDYSSGATKQIKLRFSGDTDTTVMEYMDQIQRIGHYLYGLCWTQSTARSCLVQFDLDDDTYKIFELKYPYNAQGTVPIIVDEEYLYVCGPTYLDKYRASDFQNPAFPKYNTSVVTVPIPLPIGRFNHYLYGNVIDELHGSDNKGYLHTGRVDSNYVYLGFTTGDNNTLYECQKVDKHTMMGAGWIFIPKATDDMTQNSTHLFFGIEVQPSASHSTFGYGWGTFAVRKSDLRLTGLSKFDYYDGTGTTITSYASLIFGQYLLDQKTDGLTYILDNTDVDNWTTGSTVGTHVLQILKFYFDGVWQNGYFAYPPFPPGHTAPTYSKTPNELLLDNNGNFHSFLWSSISGIMKFTVPGYSFVGTPIVDTSPAIVSGTTVTLRGGSLNDNGNEITNSGFNWGTSLSGVTGHTVYTDSGSTTPFAYTLTGMTTGGTYYFKAFADNVIGRGYGTVLTFNLGTPANIFYGIIPITNVYLGDTLLTWQTPI